jgi:hypothetical protein
MSDDKDKAPEAPEPADMTDHFQATMDRHFSRLRDCFTQASRRGRDPEVLLDLYSNLSDAAEAAEKILNGEEPQLTREQKEKAKQIREAGQHQGRIQAPVVLGARVIGAPRLASSPDETDGEPIEGRVVHVFGRQDDPNLLVAVEYGVVQMRLRACHFPVDPVEDADARARKVRAGHMDGMAEMMNHLREMAGMFGLGGTVSAGGDEGRTYPFPVPDTAPDGPDFDCDNGPSDDIRF